MSYFFKRARQLAMHVEVMLRNAARLHCSINYSSFIWGEQLCISAFICFSVFGIPDETRSMRSRDKFVIVKIKLKLHRLM